MEEQTSAAELPYVPVASATEVVDKRALLGDEFTRAIARVLGGEAVE